MNRAFFVSDLHGDKDRYSRLTDRIRSDQPSFVFIGGDLMPHFARVVSKEDFFLDFLIPLFHDLKSEMGTLFPAVFIIMGNDDPRIEEPYLLKGEREKLWYYMHNRKITVNGYSVYGYACIPPSPFRLKDWERYDVSRYVDPGCVSPTEGSRTVDTGEDIEYCTILKDLETLTGDDDLSASIFLFHAPPYQTNLDRAALDGISVEHVPLDVHIGSIAIRRFIEKKQPRITLHGHVHESSRITGHWHEQIGKTHAFNAAIDRKGLSLITFDQDDPGSAERSILD